MGLTESARALIEERLVSPTQIEKLRAAREAPKAELGTYGELRNWCSKYPRTGESPWCAREDFTASRTDRGRCPPP